MSNYLYGASIQGIQEFIFRTNKLREITGASEIINSITGLKFLEKFARIRSSKKGHESVFDL